ncbi:MAG: ferrous iron transport protein A [Planctomycetes bacterium]|nr:ferrous iron transport protein A [Planctomycetota bacterium]
MISVLRFVLNNTEPPAAVTAVPLTPDDPPSLSTLAALRRGGMGTVAAVAGDDALARRLIAAGIWPGVVVELLGAAPFGDPLLFRLHGYRLALRRAEAERVSIVPVEGAP